MTANDDDGRVPTGSRGLDLVLHGGLFRGGIYIVRGSPGTGKTILGNQLCFEAARRGGRAVYVTLLSETHSRMMGQVQGMRFFDREAVGDRVFYISAFSDLQARGLAGLMEVLRQSARDRHADVLVLDGLVNAAELASSELEYKKFVNDLHAWCGIVGCTVLFLSAATPSGPGAPHGPEQNMVDGIIELSHQLDCMRAVRLVSVTKLRRSSFLEGRHHYRIDDGGLVVYPRLERALANVQAPAGERTRLSTGVPGVDAMLGGGLAARSTTMLLGSSGSGKTILGYHYLAEGARRGEPSLLFGMFEDPDVAREKAEALGMPFGKYIDDGKLCVSWRCVAEGLMDALGEELLTLVKARQIKRLLIDGLVGFKEVATSGERIAPFFSVLVRELSRLGVTTVITEETRELYVRDVAVPTGGVSAIFHNIMFLRQVEANAELVRLISIMKTRDSAHERGLYRFEITGGGIIVRERFRPETTLVTGLLQSDPISGPRRPSGGSADS